MTIVIPTYQRESVLIETLQRVLQLNPHEVIVVDQTPSHEPSTCDALARFERTGSFRVLSHHEPSIPAAMNKGLLAAGSANVLFLDDDIVPSPGLLLAHEGALQAHPEAWAVVGQVLQPGEKPQCLSGERPFRFNSTEPAFITRAMAGNLAVRKREAIGAGGFDENFIGAAYMFETEFAGRLQRHGGKIYFEPSASIRHLRAPRGGTRAQGSHLTSASAWHSVGAYYHIFITKGISGGMPLALNRMFRSVMTKHHLRGPWWIPITLMGEARGLASALRLFAKGARLLPN